jgi:hypothetical protein
MKPNQVNGKHIRHMWSDEERLVIALLRHVYDLSWDECMSIWNHLYSRVLQREGFPASGMPKSTMQIQVGDLKGRHAGKTSWNSVMRLEPSQAHTSFAKYIKKIEAAAKLAKVHLKPKSNVSISAAGRQTVPSPKTPVMPSSRPTARIDEWELSSSEDEGPTQSSPCIQRQVRLNASLIRSYTYDKTKALPTENGRGPRDATTAGPTLSTTNSSARLSPRLRLPQNPDSRSLSRAPTLLFRAFLEGHGFKSRRVLDQPGSKAPPPPSFRSKTFRKEVHPHLRDYTRGNGDFPVLSPFISLAQNPFNALNRVKQPGLPLSFAIFFFKDIVEDGVERYGPEHLPYPYLVPAVVTEHDLDDLPGNYRGIGEVRISLRLLEHDRPSLVALLGLHRLCTTCNLQS